MLLELDSEQDLLQRMTARFLEENVPFAELRRLRDDPTGWPQNYWRRGIELGWTSLLVPEDHGGTCISKYGLVDLTLIAHEFGRRAAPGPLMPTNVVALALARRGGHDAVLRGILDGGKVASWCWSEPAPNDALGSGRFEVAVEGDGLLLNGTKRPVEAANVASHLLVSGRSEAGISQVLVPADAKGISMTPMQGVDLTRRFSALEFHNVRVPRSCLVGPLGQASQDVELQLQHATVLLCAEAVGAMQAGFDMTVEWAFDRYSFGRPLASYQALKHRFAHMATWLQASHAVTDEAAVAVASGAHDAGALASAAKAYVGEYGTELLQECVQLHGGIGVTFEHDLHLFLRRATLARTLLGPPSQHQRRLAQWVADNRSAGASQ